MYSIPTANAHPRSITAGPDGNLWFTEEYPGKVGKITPNGVITEYLLPTTGAFPAAITAGPDGNLWVTEQPNNANKIARVTTSGGVTEYLIPTANANPYGITTGPDGNLWFSEYAAGNIGRITPGGVITEFYSNFAFSHCITVGPDGNLWTTDINGFGKTTTSGASVLVPTIFNTAWLARGPDGNLWFTSGAVVGKFATNSISGRPLASYQVGPNDVAPEVIVQGPDGNLWFNEQYGSNIGKITTGGIITEYPVTIYTTDGGIAAGPDGNIWFTMVSTNQIGKLVLSNATVANLLTLDHPSLAFTTPVGGSAPASQTLAVTASSGTAFSATASASPYGNWLTVAPSAGTTNQAITVSVNQAGLAVGTYNGYVSLKAGNITELVPVTLNVTSATIANLTASPSEIDLTYAIGSGFQGPGSQALTISSTPSGSIIPFTVSSSISSPSGGAWLLLTSSGGAPIPNGTNETTPVTIMVGANPTGLSAGSYLATITITPSVGSPLNILVRLTVTSYDVSATPASLNFGYQAAGSTPSPQSIQVNGLGGALNVGFTVSASSTGNWLTVTSSSSYAPATLLVSVVPIGLAPGTYTGAIKVAAQNFVAIPVVLTVTASATLSASPSSLSFAINPGGTAPASQSIQITGSGTFTTSASSSGNWLAVTPASGGSPITLSVSVSAAGLVAGTYHGTVNITPSGGVANMIAVTLTVAPGGTVTASPTGLSFRYQLGGTVPPPQFVQVTGSSAGLPFAVLSESPLEWLSVTPFSGATPVNLAVTITPAGLGAPVAGLYTKTITVQGTGSTSGTTTIVVTLTVSSPPNVPTILALANAASYGFAGQISPGEIVTIGGTSLGPSTPLSLALDSAGKVATSLGGVTVSFNGHLAPLIYVSATQINCVVPYEVGNGFSYVQVSYGGQTSVGTTLINVPSAPGIFTLDGSGSGEAATLNTSGCPGGAFECVNGPSNPAPQGSTVVFFLTGEGSTTPSGITGAVTVVNTSGSGPLTPQPLSAPSVTIGGQLARVTFYGEAPGLVSGVLQINAIVPTGLSSGDQPLTVSFSGVSRQSQVTVAVQ